MARYSRWKHKQICSPRSLRVSLVLDPLALLWCLVVVLVRIYGVLSGYGPQEVRYDLVQIGHWRLAQDPVRIQNRS